MNYDETIRRARLALANSNPNWEEHKHPRRADGKFGSGGGHASSARNEKQKAYRKQVKEWMREDLERGPGRWADRVKKRLAGAKTDDEKAAAYEDGVNAFLYEADTILNRYPVPKSGEERYKALAARKNLIQRAAKVFDVSVGSNDDGLGGMPKRIAKELDWDVSDWEDDDPEDYRDLMSLATQRALRF